MSVLNSDKPFEELTDAEVAELEAIDWTPGQIMRAISMALEAREMSAVIDLLHRLTKVDPKSAAAIIIAIEARR